MAIDPSDPSVSIPIPEMPCPDRTGVLLIHGLTGSPTEMAPLDKVLRRAGYQTAVPLIAGHGAGHRELLATTWQDWHAGLQRDLQALARTCDDIVIVGLCVGGLLGMLLAADEERVRGVVSLSPDLGIRVPGPLMPWTRVLLPMAYHVPWLRHHGYWTQKPPYGLKNPKLRQRIAKAVAASVKGQTKEFGTFRTYVGTLRELKWLQRAARGYCSRVRCPTLVIHSVEDSMFSIRNSTMMYRELGSRQKAIAFITGCDHVITVDLRKDDVARRVVQFIAGLHGTAIEMDGVDEGYYACEIFPGLEAALAAAQDARPGLADQRARMQRVDQERCRTHSLIVRKGCAAQLVIPLVESADQRAADASVERWDAWSRLPHDDHELGGAWPLARAVIEALAFGLKTLLVIAADPEIAPDAATGQDPRRSAALPLGGDRGGVVHA